MAPTLGSSGQLTVDFLWVWDTLRERLYDEALVRRFLDEGHRDAILEQVREARSPQEVALQVNTLLDSMNVSHNHLFTDTDIEYFLFDSMFRTRDAEIPRVFHMGAQTARFDEKVVVRAVWDGAPAQRAGLRRGDVILDADGMPFRPLDSFRSGQPVTLNVRRGDETVRISVEPVHEGINASLLHAMERSMRHLSVEGFDVGFVHLWSGTCPDILKAFQRIVTEDFQGVDGILLDLRDGWGGAWYEYLDPFFEDRRDFYTSTAGRRGESRTFEPEEAEPHAWFAGPLVVVINEGTRSGKEALAFQFRKSRRALLVGETTAGAFTGGTVAFRGPFALYVATNGPVLLDGEQIEGTGVAPDIRVEDPLEQPSPGDPQLESALEVLRSLLTKGR